MSDRAHRLLVHEVWTAERQEHWPSVYPEYRGAAGAVALAMAAEHHWHRAAVLLLMWLLTPEDT